MTETPSGTPSPTPRLAAAAEKLDTAWERLARRVERALVWNNIYRATSYLRSALWTIPLLAMLLVLLIAPALRLLDGWIGWRLSGLTVAGAQALYQTTITLTLSFVVFTFGSLLVAIQVAGGQLTPRIIATTLLRDNVVRGSVGLFVFTLVFAVMALNRLDRIVYDIVSLLTAALAIACVAVFLFLIDYAARLLRPVSIVSRIGNEGLNVIRAVYPEPASAAPEVETPFVAPEGRRRTVPHAGSSGIVLAVDLDTLVADARRSGGLIQLLPQVGDFLSNGEPLFELYSGAVSISNHRLQSTVAFGPERTLEQDPLFAFRIIADIALKALSPAINDPTTGVLALDQLNRLLRVVGRRRLRSDTIADRQGTPRVVFRTPNWEDYVNVSCLEIRACGAGNVQIARRLRALLDNLTATLPARRHAALDAERRRLDLAIASLYSIMEDRELAGIPDVQGLGGCSASRQARPAGRDSASN
jgi:uncharacterized membrane protein